MSKLYVKGGKRLRGSVTPSGSKNAALPIIFATLITKGTSVIHGVPDISDVRTSLDIIRSFGAVCTLNGGTLYINTDNLEYTRPKATLTSKIRASSYLLGACLSRFGIAHLCAFGGCNFENRPIDMHLYAASRLGAYEDGDKIRAKALTGADIYFNKISVGATVNALLMSATATGKSRIYSYAHEPHVHTLIDFLRSAGADIRILPGYIEIEGRELSSGCVRINPDMIEAGTYFALSLATDSDIRVYDISYAELSPFFDAVTGCGAQLTVTDKFVKISGELTTPCEIITSPYPGFPTDLQPQMAPLMARFLGGVITERVWLGRFGYLAELYKFGVSFERCGSTAYIRPSVIRSARASAPDLRGGAALLLCALSAEGESVIENSDVIDRGYENIVEKLSSLGAEINKIL